MHTQSHALSLLLLDFLKPFLYVSHYFNRAKPECFCLFAKHTGSCSSPPAGHGGISEHPRKNVNFSVKAVFLYISGIQFGENHLYCLFSTMRGCTWRQQNFQIQSGTVSKGSRTGIPATLLVPETLTWVLEQQYTFRLNQLCCHKG